jgi:hypothetical protein
MDGEQRYWEPGEALDAKLPLPQDILGEEIFHELLSTEPEDLVLRSGLLGEQWQLPAVSQPRQQNHDAFELLTLDETSISSFLPSLSPSTYLSPPTISTASIGASSSTSSPVHFGSHANLGFARHVVQGAQNTALLSRISPINESYILRQMPLPSFSSVDISQRPDSSFTSSHTIPSSVPRRAARQRTSENVIGYVLADKRKFRCSESECNDLRSSGRLAPPL